MELSKTIFLVRHGCTENNKLDIWQGRGDFPLSAEGEEQARGLGLNLKNEDFDVVYHSPMKRALKTAQLVAVHHSPEFVSMPGFLEIDLGDFEGCRHRDVLRDHLEIYEKWAINCDVPMPGGESFNDVCKRVLPGVKAIMEAPFQRVLIVAHAVVNRAVLAGILDMDLMSARRFRMANCAYSKFLVYEAQSGRRIIVDGWNIIPPS
ncbi:MAG: histidine phosphatase family protein [bacterium]|nr:histidine phosphatase family protein [bacterium]